MLSPTNSIFEILHWTYIYQDLHLLKTFIKNKQVELREESVILKYYL